MNSIKIKQIIENSGLTETEIIQILATKAIHIDDSWETIPVKIYHQFLDLVKDFINKKELSSIDNKRRKKILTFTTIQLAQLNKSNQISLNKLGLEEIPNEIFELLHLQILDLSFNRIKSIDSRIGKLTKLRFLILNGNRISQLPKELGSLVNLSTLIVHNNKLENLPSSFSKLKKLKKLNLSKNQFKSFPQQILKLTNLRQLWMTHNNLETVPSALLEYKDINPQFKSIFLFGNPLTKIPIYSWRRNKLRELIIYLNGLKEGDVTNFEVKLIILGKGGVGKTTLMTRLKNPDTQLTELSKIKQTNGILIEPFFIPVELNIPNIDNSTLKDAKFKINMWDFGGQEIQRNIHQFFLTENALYILLWEVRSAENKYTYFKNWLNTIKSFSGENSRVILVLNKVFNEGGNEIVNAKEVINQEELRRIFPQLWDFDEISAFYNVGLNGPKGLKAKIRKHVMALPNVGEKLPRKWFQIKNQIEDIRREKNILEYKDYIKVCKDEFATERQEADLVSNWLHQIGVVLHYKKPKALEKTIILNAEWITKAVYKILLDTDKKITKAKGSFDYEYVQELLNYDNEDIILRLMEKFHLCFKLREDEKFIVPQLLPNTEPVEKTRWDYSDNLVFQYKYKHLANGTIERFIAKAYNDKLVEENLYWKTGVILSWKSIRALVEIELINDKINIYIEGKDNNTSKLLEIIRKDFRSINEKSAIEKEQIRCICKNCRSAYSQKPSFFEYSVLEDMKQKKIKRIQCMDSYDFINIDDILEHRIGKGNRLNQELVRKLVEENKIKDALNKLSSFAETKGDVERIKTVTSLSSQWNEIKRNENLGIEGPSEITKRKNQIRASILDLTN